MAKDSFFITKDFDPFVLKIVLKRNWWVPLLILFGCLSFAFFYLRYSKPVYQSNVLIQLVDDDKAKDLINIENVNSQGNLESDIELLRSQLLFEEALRRMNVSVSLYNKGKILTEERYRSSIFNVLPYELTDSSLINTPIWVKFPGNDKVILSYELNEVKYSISGKLNEHIKNKHFDLVIKVPRIEEINELNISNELFFEFNSIESLSQRFLGNLEVYAMDPAAKTIQLNFQAYNPVFCRDLLKELVASFFAYDMDLKKRGSENILSFIDQQLDSLENELQSSKDSIMDYHLRTKIVDPNVISNELNANLSTSQRDLIELEEELRIISAINRTIKQQPNRLEIYRLLPEMFGTSFEQTLTTQIESLQNLLEKKEDLLFNVTEENPEIKLLDSKIAVKTASIRKTVGLIENRLMANKKELKERIGQFQAEIFQMPEQKMEYGRLSSRQELNNKYFSLFTDRKVQYAISDAGFSSSNRVLRRPEIYLDPIKPDKKKVYSTSLGFGFLMSFLFLFLRYVRFNEINYIEDLKKILPPTLSYLGAIPFVETGMEFSELLVHDNPKSIISEALRSVRTNLSFIKADYHTIAISSSVSGEGKTFVALNLAAILAMSGKKTVLIDLDMRKPKIHVAMNSSNKKGMSNAIIGQHTWQQCVQHSEVENLDYITAGAIPPNPSELILSIALEEIVAELKKEYDIIVFDNPPVGVVSDGVKMLSEADVPIYVFKSHFSKRNFAERVVELMEVQKVSKLNIILNGVVGSRKSYGYGYGYSYGNNYGYFDENAEKKSFIKRIFTK